MQSAGERNGKIAATCFSRKKKRLITAIICDREFLRSLQSMKDTRQGRWKWKAGSLTDAKKTGRSGA